MHERVFQAAIPADLPAPNLAGVLGGDIPELIILAWRNLAGDAVDTGDYLAHLSKGLRYPYLDDPDRVAVVNTSRQAKWLEDGRAGFHLPSRWGTGRGVWKVGKDGKRYARVPLRHSTPGSDGGGSSTFRARTAMPRSVYDQALQLGRRASPGHRTRSFSFFQVTSQRLGGFGNLGKKVRDYGKMASQGMNVPQKLVDAGHYRWRASPYEGMFAATIQRTEAAPRHSQYMTVRTITPDSDGWYIPPMAGRHYAERALEAVAGEIAVLIDQAVAKDLEAAIEAITEGL